MQTTMAESVTEDRSVRGYVSCIKINGKPILPPLMTPERWVEMKRYKEMAVSIEAALNMKRNSVDSGVICPSQSSSWGNKKSENITESTSRNVHSSTSDEEALLFELVQKYTSPITACDSKKHHESRLSAISNNAEKSKTCRQENFQASHFAPKELIPVDMKVSEVHHVTMQDDVITEELDKITLKPADANETTPAPKENICQYSLSHSENKNILHQSSRAEFQDQNQSGVKLVCNEATESVLPSSSPQNSLHFGTISPADIPVVQTSSVADSAASTQNSSQNGNEARLPVKKIHASLNISEIIAQDDIIQDGLGFKVWKHNCELLERRPQHSSTPANTTEENLSAIEANRIENLDESVSSFVATASTDLNNYMNTSGSSKSSASIQSLSSFAPAVHESKIVKQTIQNHGSSSSDQSSHMQTETEDHRSLSKSTPGSQLQNQVDNFEIDGIRPLDLENEVGQLVTSGAEIVKSSIASEIETVKKVESPRREKTTDSIESNESRTSSDSQPPRLKRQHSYVLECPSPLLVEYLKSLNHDGDMTASPTKRMSSSLENRQEAQKHRLLSGSECNSSLPNSSVSSPIKLQSPFASAECLSSTKENRRTSNFAVSKDMTRKSYSSSKENLKKSRSISSETVRRLSAEEAHSYEKKKVQKMPLVPSPRCSSIDNVSTEVSRKSTRIAMKCPKTPQKTPRTASLMQNISPRNSVKRIACVSQNHSKDSLVQEPPPGGTPDKMSAQEELRAVFLQLQIEHQRQMADLLEKQKREQDAMREAFRQQQIKLMNEIRSLCPEVFSTPESHKLLTKSFTQPLNTNAAKVTNHEEESSNNRPLENMTGDLQESTGQKQANSEVNKKCVKKNVGNRESSGLHYWDDVSFSELQSTSASTSEAAEALSSSNINPPQEACQNQQNSFLTSGHVDDVSNIDSPVYINNAAQHIKENAVQQLQNIRNSTSESDTEATARENMNFASEISSNKSDFSTEPSVNAEHANCIVTSGASSSTVTQQVLYSVHTTGATIDKIHHLDEISLSSIQNISTNSSDMTEISKQVCRSKPCLPETTDNVRFVDVAVTSGASDLDENTVPQQALYGLQTDGKVVSSMLTVAKSEVILSDGLPYLEPGEGTVRTTVFTQLNGIDHNGLVNTHFSTVMHDARQSCSRELFPARSRFGTNYTKTHEIAVIRIQAGIRGYLTRRLFRTSRVQDLITTIRDTLLCAVQVSQECWPDVQPEDVALHRRLIQQVTAACYALHDVFFSLHISEQMAIIAADRERQRSHAPRTALPRPLSAATRRALERKMRQSENEGRPKTVRSRRTWMSGCDNSSGSYGIARSCLLRQQQQQMSPPELVRARYSSNSSGRRPWR